MNETEEVIQMNEEQARKLGVVQGIVYAAGFLCQWTDDPVSAEDILKAGGVTNDELRKCTDLDLAPLRKAGLTKVKTSL